MAQPSVQEQVDLLLRRSLVEDKVGGTPSTELEAYAVLESVALSLYLYPRSVLYLWHLARNGLLKTVADELSQVRELGQVIADLGNQSYAIRDLSALNRAKTSLLQIERQGRLTTANGSFKSFDSAVTEFLNGSISKNVRRLGQAELVRPGAEAADTLPSAVASLKALHADVVTRLGYFAEGVRKFVASDLSSRISKTTTLRIRASVQEVIDGLTADAQAVRSREYAVKLIAAKTVLSMVGSPPSPFDPVIDTDRGLPDGHSIEMRTPVQQVTLLSTEGPWSSEDLTLDIDTNLIQASVTIPPAGIVPAGRHMLFSSALPASVTIPPNYHLFLRIGDVDKRVPLNDSGIDVTADIDQLVSTLNVLSGGSFVAARSFSGAGARIGLYCPQPIRVVSVMIEEHVGATAGTPTTWSRSAHELLGFSTTRESSTEFGVDDVLAALDELLVTRPGFSFARVSDTQFSVTADLAAGDWATFTSDTLFGGERMLLPTAEAFTLHGEVFEVDQDVSPLDLVRPGDLVVLPGIEVEAVTVDAQTVTTAAPFPSYDGPFSVVPSIVVMWRKLQDAVDGFQRSWQLSGFSRNLDRLDALIAPLYATPTPARRAGALEALQVLERTLEGLQTVLAVGPLPRFVDEEKAVAEGVLNTLQERKYDRAGAFLLQCRIPEVLTLDWQSLSFGGELMAALSSVALADVARPDLSAGEPLRSSIDSAERSAS